MIIIMDLILLTLFTAATATMHSSETQETIISMAVRETILSTAEAEMTHIFTAKITAMMLSLTTPVQT